MGQAATDGSRPRGVSEMIIDFKDHSQITETLLNGLSFGVCNPKMTTPRKLFSVRTGQCSGESVLDTPSPSKVFIETLRMRHENSFLLYST